MQSTTIRQTASRVVGSIMDKIKKASSNFLFVLMAGLICVLGANIVLRYFFHNPIAWSNTASRYAYIFIVLVGSGIAYIEGRHAQIDIIYEKAHPWVKLVFDIAHCTIMIGLCFVLIFEGMKHSLSMMPVHAPIIPWFSVGIVYLSIPLCGLLILLFLIKKALEL